MQRSRQMAAILRHKGPSLGITVREEGYMDLVKVDGTDGRSGGPDGGFCRRCLDFDCPWLTRRSCFQSQPGFQ